MSSDVGLDYADGLPHRVFTTNEMAVDNCTACFMVATSAFFPLYVSPAVAVIITGIGRIPNIIPFLGELIGGLAMAYLRAYYLHPIAADMDCKSVTRLQDQQKHLIPEQSQSQGRVYSLILQAFFSGGKVVRNPRSATKNPTWRRPIRRLRLALATQPFLSPSGPTATGLTTSLTDTRGG
jgi:hypothetical protein